MSQDRKTLIRVASGMPAGDPVRRVLLSELQRQSDFIREHTKRIPGWVKKRLPEFIRVLDQVDLVDRQRAGSKNPSDAFSDVLKLLEHGGFERDYPRSYEKQIMRVEEKLRNDWLDEVGDDEDFPTDPFKWSMKVWEELGRQLVKAGILGKRAKKKALQKEAKLSLRAQATSNPPGIAVYVTVPPFIGDIKKLNDRVLDQLYDVVAKAIEKASGHKMTYALWLPEGIDALELDVASGKGLHITVHFSEIELANGTTPSMTVLRDAAKGIRQ